jgi:hypothetical protein
VALKISKKLINERDRKMICRRLDRIDYAIEDILGIIKTHPNWMVLMDKTGNAFSELRSGSQKINDAFECE